MSTIMETINERSGDKKKETISINNNSSKGSNFSTLSMLTKRNRSMLSLRSFSRNNGAMNNNRNQTVLINNRSKGSNISKATPTVSNTTTSMFMRRNRSIPTIRSFKSNNGNSSKNSSSSNNNSNNANVNVVDGSPIDMQSNEKLYHLVRPFRAPSRLNNSISNKSNRDSNTDGKKNPEKNCKDIENDNGNSKAEVIVSTRKFRGVKKFNLFRKKKTEAKVVKEPESELKQITISSSSSTQPSSIQQSESGLYRLENTKIFVNKMKSNDDIFHDIVEQPSTSSTLSSSTELPKDNDRAPQKSNKIQEEVQLNSNRPQSKPTCDCADAYRDVFCGNDKDISTSITAAEIIPKLNEVTNIQERKRSDSNSLSGDPTVEESIECVFASKLQDGELIISDDDFDECKSKTNNDHDHDVDLTSPAGLQQSFSKHREYNEFKSSSVGPNSNNVKENKGKCEENLPQGHKHSCKRLNHLGSIVDTTRGRCDGKDASNDAEASLISQLTPLSCLPLQKIQPSSSSSCVCKTNATPNLPINQWPQYPLLLRAKPNCGVTIRGIRYSKSTSYIWQPEYDHNSTWLQKLQLLQQKKGESKIRSFPSNSPCQKCTTLPINNGNEPVGDALVIDFETKLFQGTFMIRLRYARGVPSIINADKKDYDDDIGYFNGLNRRYQVLIRGKFKQEISMTQCVSGFSYDRPLGRLPSKFLVRGALKVVSFFAPQMRTSLDGSHPYSLAPLGSTPQTVMVQNGENEENNDIILNHNNDDHMFLYLDDEKEVFEPIDVKQTILGENYPNSIIESSNKTSLLRSRYRKKQFDKLYSKLSPFPQTDRSKVYTFEFLQHLVDFKGLQLDLGSFLGNMSLKEVLDGHPIQIMAAAENSSGSKLESINETDKNGTIASPEGGHMDTLWAFELWHSSLVEDSINYDANLFV